MNILNPIDKFLDNINVYKEKYSKTFIILENVFKIIFDICIFTLIFFGHTNESIPVNKWYRISVFTLILMAILLNMLKNLKDKNIFIDSIMKFFSPLIFSVIIMVIFGDNQADLRKNILSACYTGLTPLLILLVIAKFKEDSSTLAYFPFVFCLTMLIIFICIDVPSKWLFILIIPFMLMQYRAYLITKKKRNISA